MMIEESRVGTSLAAKPGASTDEEWGKSFISPSAFVALVYKGV